MSDAKWQSIARKGADLLRKNGIFLDNVERKIALVEADGAKVIGAAAFYTSSFRNGTVTYSFDLAVDERYRGKGVGRALLDGVLRIIDQASRFTTEPHVRVDVNVVNAPLLEALRRRGFVIKHLPGINEWHALKDIR